MSDDDDGITFVMNPLSDVAWDPDQSSNNASLFLIIGSCLPLTSFALTTSPYARGSGPEMTMT
jgi:hypothetical protein